MNYNKSLQWTRNEFAVGLFFYVCAAKLAVCFIILAKAKFPVTNYPNVFSPNIVLKESPTNLVGTL